MLFQSQITEFIHLFPTWRTNRLKTGMRGLLEQKRRMLTSEEITAQSAEIVARLEDLPEFKQAKVVMCFYPIRNEIDVRPLLNKYMEEKTILLPVAHRQTIEMRQYTGRKNMKKGRFGIPEPQTSTYNGPAPDLILVPGVAFDRAHRRLGRGRGYYDRYLSAQKKALKVALAYNFQIVKEVPATRFDHKVDRVVTPTEVF